MSDIFISYAREDESRVKPLVSAFESEGWSVFWDRRIPAGSTWRNHIGSALQQARCVVAVWSAHSVESQWVAEEADEGKMRQALVPVALDAVTPPRGFREIQAADLTGWKPGEPSENLRQLLADVRRLIGSSTPAPSPAPPASSQERPPPLPKPGNSTERGGRKILLAAIVLLAVGIGAYLAFRPPPTAVQSSLHDEPSSRPPPQGVAPAGDWLVVAGSFTRNERRNADARLAALASAGLNARIIDSSEYPLLTPNLLVVVLGPFESREMASAELGRLKPHMADAYVKKGQ